MSNFNVKSSVLMPWLGKMVLSAVAVIFCAVNVQAQSFAVSGKVSGPMGGGEIGAIIYVKDNNAISTITDAEGNYSLSLKDKNSVLVVTLLGYKDAEVAVAGRSVVNVTLEPDVTALEEVVIVGYGTQRKEFVVGSVSQVTSKEMMKAPVTNMQNMLSGRLAGLTTMQTSGTPGDDFAQLRIRGTSTFADASPLFIVDGVEQYINYINPADVASVSILKDAATAAIYGVRGANGVVLVTTKSGSLGKAKISYDGSVSFDTNTAMPEMLDADGFVYWHNKAMELDGQQPIYTEEYLGKLAEIGILGDTNYLEQIYKPFGLTHQHNVSVNGGTEKIRYFASIGYMGQDGILLNTGFKRYNVRTSIDANIAKNLNFKINLGGFHSERNWPGFSISPQNYFSPIEAAFFSLPIYTPTYNGLALGFRPGDKLYNPVSALTQSGYNKQNRWDFNGRASLEYSFDSIEALKGLKISVFGALNYSNTLDYSYMQDYQLYQIKPGETEPQLTDAAGIDENSFNRSTSYGYDIVLRPQISYDRTFGRHHVSFLGLYEMNTHYGETMTGYKKGFFSDYPVDISMGIENNPPYVSGSFKKSAVAGYAGRIGYAFDEKYLVEATMRADASYKFAPKNRWGFFPSIALGWVISNEGFFKDAVPVINHLKLRASYGLLGSDNVDPYLYMQTFRSTAPGYSYVIGGKEQMAYYTSGYVYDNLTWSRTNTYNVGFDLRMLKNKLTVEFDWFYKYTSKILENESGGSTYSPSLGGNNPVWMNSGRMDNRGLELTVRHDNWFANGWSYSIAGMISWSRNKVLSKKITDNHPSYRAVLGEPLGSIYGFNALGLFQTQEQVDNYPTAPSGWAELGAIMYEDVNGDGKIEKDHDYVKIGRSRTPEMIFSLNFDVAWKDISLSALFQGATLCNYALNGVYNNGNQDNTMYTRPFYGNGNAARYLVEDSWTPDNTGARYPRLSASTNAINAWSSTWWVKDGSYLRLKNVQLTYSLPKSLLAKAKIERVSVFLAGTNLFTISAFKYVDPEQPGINNGYYPQQRTYSLGLNLTF